jgi:hypothetical protein
MTQASPLFSTSNKHVADSGTPPQFDGDAKGRYHGYFENAYGEQAVFVYDRQAGSGKLWMGDNGWEKPVAVVDGEAQGLVLGEAESIWLQACWQAVIGSPAT